MVSLYGDKAAFDRREMLAVAMLSACSGALVQGMLAGVPAWWAAALAAFVFLGGVARLWRP